MATSNPADARLRAGAQLLGEVYAALAARGNVPLDSSAMVPVVVPHGANPVKSPLLQAINDVVQGSQNADDLHAKRRVYSNAYHLVVPAIEKAAAASAASMTQRQFGELRKLERRLAAPGVAERLHTIAVNVVRRVGGFKPSEGDHQKAKAKLGRDEKKTPVLDPNPHRTVTEDYDVEFNQAKWEFMRARVLAAFAAEWPTAVVKPGDRVGDPARQRSQEVRQLCQILAVHPNLVGILMNFADSAGGGDRFVRGLVVEAMGETHAFSLELRDNPDHVWRYPPLVAMGVKQLGLTDDLDFIDYIADLRRVRAANRELDALLVIGLVVMFIGFVASFPLSAAVAAGATGAYAGLAGLALVDLAVALPTAVLTYLEEREKDLAATSGSFSRAPRLGTSPDYSRTSLSATAALLAGIAFLAYGAKFIRTLRPVNPKTPPTPPSRAARLRGPKGPATAPPRGARSTERPTRPPDTHWHLRPQRPGQPRRAAVGAAPPQEPPDAVSAMRPPPRAKAPDDRAPVASGTGTPNSAGGSTATGTPKGRGGSTATGSTAGGGSGAAGPSNRRTGDIPAGPHGERAAGSRSRFTDDEISKDFHATTFDKTGAGARAVEETGVAGRALRAAYHYHHLLVQELAEWFRRCGISDIHRYTVKLSVDEHTFIHMQAKWNDLWKAYRQAQIAKGMPYPGPQEILAEMRRLMHQEGLEGLKIVRYPFRRR